MFSLTILVSADRLGAIKNDLTRRLPDVKSMHRCEAIARGLGFQTYASALAAVKMEAPRLAKVRGDIFTAYLAEHAFTVAPRLIYYASAKIALQDVSNRAPKLTMWGIGVGRPRRKEDGSWENGRDLSAKFKANRAELIGDGAVKPFLTSLAFLERVKPTKTVRRGRGVTG